MSTALIDNQFVLPPSEPEEISAVEKFLAVNLTGAILRAQDGSEVTLPDELLEILSTAVHSLANGQAINVAPVNLHLTTQQAADILSISRPSLVKLLESGEIPFECVGTGTHRRVRLSDLLDYQSHMRAKRRAILSRMFEEDQEAGLNDLPLPDNYLEIVAQVRKNRQRK